MNNLIPALIVPLIICGCGAARIQNACDNPIFNAAIQNKLTYQIDSVYTADTLFCSELRKVVRSKCVDGLLEITTINKCNDSCFFYFDANMKFEKLITEL